MAKAKHQKSKPNKPPHMKKHGKLGDISEFRAQLDALGLKIIQVTADGNCFFRALADQLDGNEEEHEKYRSMVVQFILKNAEMFEPFIEDDVPFDEYCQSMEKDGTWAGHMELQAASLVTHTNICIHQRNYPRWYIKNFDNHEARMIHLSYHDGEHYNSVRLKEDTCTGPARPIIIKADTGLPVTSHQAEGSDTKSKRRAGKNFICAESVKLVMAGGGCQDDKKVGQVLHQVGGDVDAAIEFLIAERGSEDFSVESDKIPSPADTSHGARENESIPQQNKLKSNSSTAEPSCNGKINNDNGSSQQDEKKIPRNKVCPCGSKKKYKACCGSVSGRSSTKFAVDEEDLSIVFQVWSFKCNAPNDQNDIFIKIFVRILLANNIIC
ncbi:OVARIAN TUMOR DOMAIN-containing deubiquitinating enzyme 7 isoform X3 [Diospyros lotus]|uniref:OVARIAN TUMOR DOMAIN-containing deubiquitinating enzyme 7 isoform X3 n=1 Tax=Diospyros lotus TaxID=55363 RepID=UPI0022511FAE|nr:OVARIAN TUMOR DOMAIN-containing deubiquitinating enzyme 7 isoform X3 [Diospyros lotus]